ncbi:MAG TPA: toll/interleukin-1 receptor domain-containing protein [Albitalea sp.]
MARAAGKAVLVYGTLFANRAKQRTARMVATMLVDAGLDLVTGRSPGVDRWVAEQYCGELATRELPVAGRFTQIASPGLAPPFRRYAAPAACRVRTPDFEAWKREALARSDAAVMIGGGRGALDIARRFIERGRPVFPVPFLGGLTGSSDFVFQEILKTWEAHPVPGVSRTQYLRLAEPWVGGTGPLANLLLGTLADAPDLFVSYRRSDAPAAAGRIAHDLTEHFGQRRVFLDIHGIAPSRPWVRSIDEALASCRAGIVVIGRDWLAPSPGGAVPRLAERDDVVRQEIETLLDPRGGKAVFPVLVDGARLPEADRLPESLRPLLAYQVTALDNAGWTTTLARLAREIETLLAQPAAARGDASTEVAPPLRAIQGS